jgi:hypothetical protein
MEIRIRWRQIGLLIYDEIVYSVAQKLAPLKMPEPSTMTIRKRL